MGKLLLKKTQVFFLAFLFITILNIIVRLYFGYSFIPKYFLIDTFIIFMILLPSYLLRYRLYSLIYTSVIVFVFVLLFVVNITYYVNLDTPFYISILKFLGEAKEVVNASYINWGLIAIGFAVEALYVGANILIDHFYKYPIVNRLYVPFGAIISLIGIILSYVGISINAHVIYNRAKDTETLAGCKNGFEIINFYSRYYRNSSFKTYGMLAFYASEYSLYWGNGSSGNLSIDVDDEYEINSYTNLLNGYNIVTIMIETGIYEAVSEEFTPNLYMLESGGLNCTNTYSKNKTATSEIIGFTGSFPSYGINYNYKWDAPDSIYKFRTSSDKTLPYLLKEKDYYNSFFHDGLGLYARNDLMGQFGFDSYKHEYYETHGNSYAGAWAFDGSYELDSDYIDIVIDDMFYTDRTFYTYWTTLSTHGPYSDQINDETSKRDELFKEMGYIDKFDDSYEEVYGNMYGKLDDQTYKEFRHFICAMMNLDEAVGKIINKLKEINEFDNTLFVIYGDHEAYYNNLSKKLSQARGDDNKYKMYHTLLFFFNKTLTDKYRELNSIPENMPCEFDYFTSPYIIVPTILDLVGIRYNTKYFFTPSIFSYKTKFDGVFYSEELTAFLTNLSYSDDGVTFGYKDESLTEEDIMLLKLVQSKRMNEIIYIDSLYDEWFYYVD